MIIRYLNIEVAFGVIALACVAQHLLGILLPISWYLVVPPSVWAVYTLDRVIDVRHASGSLLSGRHRFALSHRRLLTMISTVVLGTSAIVAAVQFPLEYWLVAVGLGILTLSHLLWQRSKGPLTSIIKDANVALVYTVGAWSIPIVMAGALDFDSAIVLCALILIVFVDVIWLSVIDHSRDAEANAPSIAVAMGKERAATVARTISFVVMTVLLVWMMIGGDVAISATLIAMALIYAIVPVVRMSDPDIARIVLELVLVLPLWLVLL